MHVLYKYLRRHRHPSAVALQSAPTLLCKVRGSISSPVSAMGIHVKHEAESVNHSVSAGRPKVSKSKPEGFLSRWG